MPPPQQDEFQETVTYKKAPTGEINSMRNPSEQLDKQIAEMLYGEKVANIGDNSLSKKLDGPDPNYNP